MVETREELIIRAERSMTQAQRLQIELSIVQEELADIWAWAENQPFDLNEVIAESKEPK